MSTEEKIPAMYTVLFNAVTDAITLLQNAQRKAEELYISNGEAVPDIEIELAQRIVDINAAHEKEQIIGVSG